MAIELEDFSRMIETEQQTALDSKPLEPPPVYPPKSKAVAIPATRQRKQSPVQTSLENLTFSLDEKIGSCPDHWRIFHLELERGPGHHYWSSSPISNTGGDNTLLLSRAMLHKSNNGHPLVGSRPKEDDYRLESMSPVQPGALIQNTQATPSSGPQWQLSFPKL